MSHKLIKYWYQKNYSLFSIILLPFAFIFWLIIKFRRTLYRCNYLKTYRASAPVIVVGNITVGGSGKTPMVVWLAENLLMRNWRPGIVSRGYGTRLKTHPHLVSINDDAKEVGDEALLLQQSTKCPVVICKNRAKAIEHLLAKTSCNIVISDDGLQHYRMARDIEIVMVDGEREFGNHLLLPAGPLREPLSRLEEADFVVIKNQNKQFQNFPYHFNIRKKIVYSLGNKNIQYELSYFKNLTIHAVAAIAHPEQFFSMLEEAGLKIIPHHFRDHYQFKFKDLTFDDDYPILMTEKDAIKCVHFTNDKFFVVAIDMAPNKVFYQNLWMNKIFRRKG